MKIPKFEAQTEWVKPTEFPDLRKVDEIAMQYVPADLADLIPRGAFSTIMHSFGLKLSSLMAARYGSGSGFPMLNLSPVIIESNLSKKSFGVVA